MQTLEASPIRTSFYQITVCALEKKALLRSTFPGKCKRRARRRSTRVKVRPRQNHKEFTTRNGCFRLRRAGQRVPTGFVYRASEDQPVTTNRDAKERAHARRHVPAKRRKKLRTILYAADRSRIENSVALRPDRLLGSEQ